MLCSSQEVINDTELIIWPRLLKFIINDTLGNIIQSKLIKRQDYLFRSVK